MTSPKERTVSLSKRPTNMGHKIPYVDIISEAIQTSPNRRLTAKEIFDHVSARFGPMKSAETLKNTIRHTLSRYKIFRKVQRGKQKKPNWWTIEEDATSDHEMEDLQEDIKPAIPPPSVLLQNRQTMIEPHVHHQNQQRLSLSLDVPEENQYQTSVHTYQPSATVQQFPHVYFPEGTQQAQNQTEVTMSRGTGSSSHSHQYNIREYELIQGEYRPLLMNDSLVPVAGPSHSAYPYGIPSIGDTIPYLFPYQVGQSFQEPATTFPPANMVFLPSAPSPVAEYFQM